MKLKSLITLCLLLLFAFPSEQFAQNKSSKKSKDDKKEYTITPASFKSLKFRNIGPFRGGRSVAVAGVVQNSQIYYMGSTGGGMWKTEDAGISWKNISDGQFKMGSVGAIGVAESDPNVIYVGMGEHAIRGVMTSHGDGVYKSTDAGQTWVNVGLEKTKHISDVIVHPKNPDVVYVSAQGAAHGPNEDRGIYKSIDGGKSWTKTLFVDDNTGASGLSMDMNNPRILYAAMWEHTRFPWQVKSGGKGSGLYKSSNSGDTWTKMKTGLPEMMGKAGISVSRANSNVVYANIEAEKSGVYKSVNGGKNWSLVNSDRIAVTRSWYYMEIFADPINEDVVYVLNAPMLKSIDGGKNFSNVSVPHGDNHDLWIHPANNQIMINANDGGANVSFNGGASWSTQENQPTVQFYRVITDNRFPYYVYGGQQDNSTVAIASRTNNRGIGWKDWNATAGGESAFITFDEDNPRYVYGGSYQGNISEFDSQTQMNKDIMAYPVVGLGSLPKEMKYRFNWNSPIVMSQHDKKTLYHGSQMVLRSTDGGDSWEEISPDLTRNDKSKQEAGGVPFTNEGAGGENYNTLAYLVESPHKAGVLWAGSDCGLVHTTQDGGLNWTNVTPPKIEEGIINAIEVSPHDSSTVYVTLLRYKMNDYTPYVFKTTDNGKSWEAINNGFADEDYVRVVREDKVRKDLLYAGTETGLYLSFNGGNEWTKYPFNLPTAPLNDITIRDNDMVIATSGRGFWILDHLGALQQIDFAKDVNASHKLIAPKTTVRFDVPAGSKAPEGMGQNPLNGVILDYHLGEAVPDSVELTMVIKDVDGNKIRSYSNQKEKGFKGWPGGPSPKMLLPAKQGFNRVAWDFRRNELPAVDGVFVLGDYRGSIVAPGKYTAILSLSGSSQEVPISIVADPRIMVAQAAYDKQYAMMVEVEGMVETIHEAVNRMRNAGKQVVYYTNQLEGMDEVDSLMEKGKSLQEAIKMWEENLIQPKQKTFQDVINFPNQLNTDLLDLRGRMDNPEPTVTKGSEVRLADLKLVWAKHNAELTRILEEEVTSFNQLYKNLDIPALLIKD
jgi:photosystem II stability/assembly factor-like uncharacterized protein